MKQPSIAMIAMDMDGTLLRPSPTRVNPITEGVLRSLHMAHDAGVILVLASGRIPDDAGFFAYDTGIPMHILGLNGTCCMDKPFGEIIVNHVLNTAETSELISMMDNLPVHYGLFSGQDLLISNGPVSDKELQVHWGTYISREGSRCHVYHECDMIPELLARGTNKLLVRSQYPEVLATLKVEIEKRFIGFDVTSSWTDNLEINPKGIDKGSALRALADRLSIPMEQVMAIGDNDNDIPMLQSAGFGVAMANSTKAVLNCADFRTSSNAEDGVACAIRQLVFGMPEGVIRLHE